MGDDLEALKRRMGKPGGRPKHHPATERNKMFLQLVEEGYSYRQIGLQFDLSSQAVMMGVRSARKARESNLT